MRSVSIVLVVASALALVANASTVRKAAEAAKCGEATLCSSCSHLEGCQWCADGQGSCVPESSKKCANKVTNDYCLHEPCTRYSSCQTCLADAFCGWCGALNACIEGEKVGPLTGSCPSWEYGRCSKDNNPFEKGAAGVKETLQGADGNTETEAVTEIDRASEKLKEENQKAASASKEIMRMDKTSGSIISHLKQFIAKWRQMADPQESSFVKARKAYHARLQAIQKKRRHTLDVIRTVLKEEYRDEVSEAKEVKQLLDEEENTEVNRMAVDRSIIANGTTEAAAVKAWDIALPFALNKGDVAMGGVENFLKKITHKDKILMHNMHKLAENSVEQELHKAAVRKMAREEAAWYSCAWLVEKPSRSCADFHENYNGAQRQKDLTPEEHTRVCNEVQTRLSSQPAGTLPSKAGGRDKALSWCVQHASILCAKCK